MRGRGDERVDSQILQDLPGRAQMTLLNWQEDYLNRVLEIRGRYRNILEELDFSDPIFSWEAAGVQVPYSGRKVVFVNQYYYSELEKALLDGRMEGGDALDQPIPTMHLDYVFKKQELKPDSGVREALLYAIHLEKGAVDYYGTVANGCAGAPMGNLFKQLLAEESRHLQSLEDLYEQHFMTEN